MRKFIKDLFCILCIGSSVFFFISIFILMNNDPANLNHILALCMKWNIILLPILVIMSSSANLAYKDIQR